MKQKMKQKMKPKMKFADNLMGKLFIGLIGITFFISGCGKKAQVSSSGVPGGKVEEQNTNTSNKIKTWGLGQAEDFVILAYAGISSVPNSKINGKVGLMPGTREQITLDPSEVAGGITDILGSDDESEPYNLLSNAKVDMVTTYTKVNTYEGDKDKIGLYDGTIGGKTLSPGCYQWNDGITVDKDFIIEGTESDTWIFKIKGNLTVNEGVKVTLSGGAKAKNIIWQVAGAVDLGANSLFAGTIIAQPSIELRNHSVLNGRAFAKNGFVSLNQATINKPE